MITGKIVFKNGADRGGSNLINEMRCVNSHKVDKGKSSADDMTVNKSSVTIPDPDPVPFPKGNRQDGKMSATLFQCGEPMHICQGIMTHLTNETVKELSEDTIIDIDEDDAGNTANNNNNEDANEDDASTDSPMMRQVD